MPIAPATSQSFASDLDRRSGARRPLRVSAALALDGGHRIQARTIDVGLHALSIVVEQNLPAQTDCEVSLSLPVSGQAHALRLRARVVHGVLSSNGFRLDLSLHSTTADEDKVLERFVTQ